jgi:hypothetical protein
MTPIVPFDPGRSPAGPVRGTLRAAYSEAAIRSFLDKLRQLAVMSPELCQELFQHLDTQLTGMLDEVTRERRNERLSGESSTATVDDEQRAIARVLTRLTALERRLRVALAEKGRTR